MLEVATLLLVLVLSLLITRVATVALTLTGLPRPVARFQARSAITRTGFAATDMKRLLSHPVRRRILMWLMLLGNGGLIVVAALLIVAVSGDGGLWS